jgi:GNAT superfamily N-acetyltransferase
MSLELCPAGPQHETFLYQLAYEHFFEELRADLWQPEMCEALIRIQIEGQRTSYAAAFPRAHHGIIMLHDRPVGRLLIDRGPQVDHIVDILLAKQYRAKGIGTVLLRAICTEADLMRKTVRLEVATTNRAVELYRRFGFRTIEDYQVRLLMERTPGAVTL